MSKEGFHIEPGSRESATIRAAYEVLLGCLLKPEITAHLDAATVRQIAGRLNDLLPGAPVEQPPSQGAVAPATTVGALWCIEEFRRLRIIDAIEGEGPRVEVYKADLRALMEVQVPVKP
jgi:hypothetical protein